MSKSFGTVKLYSCNFMTLPFQWKEKYIEKKIYTRSIVISTCLRRSMLWQVDNIKIMNFLLNPNAVIYLSNPDECLCSSVRFDKTDLIINRRIRRKNPKLCHFSHVYSILLDVFFFINKLFFQNNFYYIVYFTFQKRAHVFTWGSKWLTNKPNWINCSIFIDTVIRKRRILNKVY